MTNLLTVLPEFDIAPFGHILPSLERALISTADLLTLEAADIAKRAQVPPHEVGKLADALVQELHNDLGSIEAVQSDDASKETECVDCRSTSNTVRKWQTISTLDDSLDAALGGGIALGHLTEIVGESAAGKTQYLLSLLLSAQLLETKPPDKESEKASALYISTEAPLQTVRLTQILKENPKLSGLSPEQQPSLTRVQSTHVHDVEAQEHILRYQLPVAIAKHNVRLVVIDSIAANYRAEFGKGGQTRKTAEALAKRSTQVSQIGSLLRELAQTYNIAVVVANQVADRFNTLEQPPPTQTQSTQSTWPGSPQQPPNGPMTIALPMSSAESETAGLSTDDPLALDHQQRFFTGWGDGMALSNLKTPSLGLSWTNQLSTRIALLKQPIYEDRAYQFGDERNLVGWKRKCKVVFSTWCAESTTDFEIWSGGIRSLPAVVDGKDG